MGVERGRIEERKHLTSCGRKSTKIKRTVFFILLIEARFSEVEIVLSVDSYSTLGVCV